MCMSYNPILTAMQKSPEAPGSIRNPSQTLSSLIENKNLGLGLILHLSELRKMQLFLNSSFSSQCLGLALMWSVWSMSGSMQPWRWARVLGRGGSSSDPDVLTGTLCLWAVLQVPYDPAFRAPKEIDVLTVLDWKLPKPYTDSIFIWVFMQHPQYM